MSHNTSELITQKTIAREQLAHGAKVADMSLICNMHATVAQAEASVAHVRPGSAAFLEGVWTGGEDEGVSEMLDLLNQVHTYDGTQSRDYLEMKGVLLLTLPDPNQYVPEGPTDFGANTLACFRELLQKDCFINFADHADRIPQSDADTQSIAFNKRYHDSQQYAWNTALPEINAQGAIAPALRHLKASHRGEATSHFMRERQAALKSLVLLGHMAVHRQQEHIPRTPEGKIPAYILYGSLHARSLAYHFEYYNADVRLTELTAIPEYMYIDPANKIRANTNRRLAHTALMNLTFDFAPPYTEAIIGESYRELKFLNAKSPAEADAFLALCATIKREQNRDWDNAYAWYQSLMRSFMPYPQVFGGRPDRRKNTRY